jgi:hypothetical protein
MAFGATACQSLSEVRKGPAEKAACACPTSSAASVAPPPADSAAPLVAPAASADGSTLRAKAVTELIVSANRKMMHGDGRGCLADIAEARRLDFGTAAQLDMILAQCEMLDGRCQEGKERVSRFYQGEMAMGPERALALAESIASLRCRAGDSTERDLFLRAGQELSEAAYLETKSASFCEERIRTLVELGPRVPMKDVDDTVVSGTKQALFHTAAACLARAGDCAGAFRRYEELFPRSEETSRLDPKAFQELIRTSFHASMARCPANH